MKITELDNESVLKVIEESGFTYDAGQDIFYSMTNPWQRQHGYCRLYDEAAPSINLIIDSEPVRFEYGGKKWLVEFWKGQYGMTTGAEIGVYTTTGPDLDIPGVFYGTFYDRTDEEDHLNMSMVLYKNSKKMFSRSGTHWWLTGFILGEFSEPHELMVEYKVELKSPEMRNVFLEALTKMGYTDEDTSVEGLVVKITFGTPKSEQPKSRTKIAMKFSQSMNKYFCNTYNKMTKSFKTTTEKLEYVRKVSPLLFMKIKTMGKSKKMYKASKSLISGKNKGGV